MKPALLIIDVQTVLCTGRWACVDVDRVVDRINEVGARMRAAAAPVFLIQHEDDAGLRYGTKNWQLYERVAVGPDDVRVRKTASDSFHRTELQALLRARDVNRLVACGLQSEFCVDSTVRGALALGYSVTLVSDAHTTMDNGVLTAAQIAAHHNTTLANLDSYGPRVSTTSAQDLRLEPWGDG